VFAAFLSLLALADRLNYQPIDHLEEGIRIAAAAATIIVAAIALRFASRAQRLSNVRGAVVCTFGAYVGALCIAGIAAFPAVDQWQNLTRLADNIHYETHDGPLALLDPDETTIAMLDYRLRTPSSVLDTTGSDAAHVVSGWFRLHGKRSRVLVLLPGHAPGGVTRFLSRFHTIPPPGDGVAGTLATEGTASIVRRFELPQGRRYALLGPPPS